MLGRRVKVITVKRLLRTRRGEMIAICMLQARPTRDEVVAVRRLLSRASREKIITIYRVVQRERCVWVVSSRMLSR